MKTKYEAPEMNLLLLDVADVITTSGAGLNKNETYDTTTDYDGTTNWGGLWGQKGGKKE